MLPIYIRTCKEYGIRMSMKSYGAYNNTKDYIVVRLGDGISIPGRKESIDTLILAPQEKTKGHFDGAITKNGTILKVSAKAPQYVNFEVFEDEHGNFQMKITDKFCFVVNKFYDMGKRVCNIFGKNYKLSGIYLNQDKENADLKGWWEKATEANEAGLPEQWESNYESERQKALREKLSEVIS